MSEVKTYKFSTFQEFFDRVPADRMLDCLGELGFILVKSKQTLELIDRSARALAEADGVTIPPSEQLLVLPELEWIDDGKGELVAHFHDPRDKKELFAMSLAADGSPTFTVPAKEGNQ